MNIKLLCSCGTKFAFDIEPVAGRMPFAINCPGCGLEVTEFANQYIAQTLAAPPPEAPAPAPPPVGTPPAPAGLVLKGRAAPLSLSPEAAPADSGVTAPVETGGLKLNVKEGLEEPPAPTVVAGRSGEAPARGTSTEGFEAKREERLAELRKKRDTEEKMWAKVARIGWAIGLFVAALLGAYLWYYFSGSHPKDYYEVKLQGDGYGARAKLIEPDRLLVLDDAGVALHDLKEGNTLWTTPTKGAAGSDPANQGGGDGFFARGGAGYALHVTDTDIWALSGNRVLQLDRNAGTQKKEFPLQGGVLKFAPTGGALFVLCGVGEGRIRVTRIDLASGEAASAEAPAGFERLKTASRNSAFKEPTQANLLAEEFGLRGGLDLYKYRTGFIPAGDNLARMEVRLVEAKVVSVKAMKDAGPSKLNARTTAAANPMAIAEEVMNEERRAGGAAYKEVDESTYEVTLNRLLTEGVAPWKGTTTGTVFFFAMNTVDVLAGSKEIHLFDKQNKLLKRDNLASPIAGEFASGFHRPGASPCLEDGNTLYFFDQQVLTAFSLPSGEVRWRLTSVGISRIQLDGQGHLYVNTTSASPDSVQYSEQINLTDRAQPVVLKVDAETGKILWKREDLGQDCHLSGKFLFSTRQKGGVALSPFAPVEEESVWIYRLNPRNGKVLWEHFCKPAPGHAQFLENRILLQNSGEVRVLKFLSL